MADAHMPDEFTDAVAHHLPPEPPGGPKGGRPRVGHRVVVLVIRSVPTTGARGEDVPPGLGRSGRAARRRLQDREEAGARDRRQADLLGYPKRAGELGTDTASIDGVTVGAFGGGAATGPGPVGRRESGAEPTPMVDPLGGAAGDPHRRGRRRRPPSDHPLAAGVPRGRRHAGPAQGAARRSHAGRGSDGEEARASLRRSGAEPHVAERRTPHGGGLGKIRWVVGRTIGGLEGSRRLRVRYDRQGVTIDARTTMAAGVIRPRILHRDAV